MDMPNQRLAFPSMNWWELENKWYFWCNNRNTLVLRKLETRRLKLAVDWNWASFQVDSSQAPFGQQWRSTYPESSFNHSLAVFPVQCPLSDQARGENVIWCKWNTFSWSGATPQTDHSCQNCWSPRDLGEGQILADHITGDVVQHPLKQITTVPRNI